MEGEELHSCGMASHYCGVLCRILSWEWPKRAETRRRFTTCFLSRSHNVIERVRSGVKWSDVKWRDLKRGDKSLNVEGREKWAVKWSDDLWWNVYITLDWQLHSLCVGYCTVCDVAISCLTAICFMSSALCYVQITCFMFFIILLCLFSCFVCSVFCIVLYIVSPHVYCCLFSIRVQFYRPLSPGVSPITVNKFHIVLLYL